jgi:aryl-alcohol dehydrogenase-like predicted oxidoreductase
MRMHAVGTTDIRVSEIGFGCWTMGGPNWSLTNGQPIGWGDVKEDEVLAGIKAGLDAGVNHFDNADIYGNGRAERMLADCLGTLGVARDKVVIATKVGHFRGTAVHAYEPHYLRKQCEQSLRNLKTDYIDLYYLHHDNWAPDNQPGNLSDAAEEMHKLLKEGKIRAIGQSAYSDKGFARSVEVLKPAVFQSWASMLFDNFIRPGAPVQDLMTTHKIGFVAFSPLAQGLLLDKFDPENPPSFDEGDVRQNRPDFQTDRLRQLKPRVAKLKDRFGATTEDLASAACRFVAAHPNVCSVIPGFRNERQARCNVRGGQDAPFTDADAAYCRDLFKDLQLRG